MIYNESAGRSILRFTTDKPLRGRLYGHATRDIIVPTKNITSQRSYYEGMHVIFENYDISHL